MTDNNNDYYKNQISKIFKEIEQNFIEQLKDKIKYNKECLEVPKISPNQRKTLFNDIKNILYTSDYYIKKIDELAPSGDSIEDNNEVRFDPPQLNNSNDLSSYHEFQNIDSNSENENNNNYHPHCNFSENKSNDPSIKYFTCEKEVAFYCKNCNEFFCEEHNKNNKCYHNFMSYENFLKDKEKNLIEFLDSSKYLIKSIILKCNFIINNTKTSKEEKIRKIIDFPVLNDKTDESEIDFIKKLNSVLKNFENYKKENLKDDKLDRQIIKSIINDINNKIYEKCYNLEPMDISFISASDYSYHQKYKEIINTNNYNYIILIKKEIDNKALDLSLKNLKSSLSIEEDDIIKICNDKKTNAVEYNNCCSRNSSSKEEKQDKSIKILNLLISYLSAFDYFEKNELLENRKKVKDDIKKIKEIFKNKEINESNIPKITPEYIYGYSNEKRKKIFEELKNILQNIIDYKEKIKEDDFNRIKTFDEKQNYIQNNTLESFKEEKKRIEKMEENVWIPAPLFAIKKSSQTKNMNNDVNEDTVIIKFRIIDYVEKKIYIKIIGKEKDGNKEIINEKYNWSPEEQLKEFKLNKSEFKRFSKYDIVVQVKKKAMMSSKIISQTIINPTELINHCELKKISSMKIENGEEIKFELTFIVRKPCKEDEYITEPPLVQILKEYPPFENEEELEFN
jgi:hypothetical protein